MDPTRFPLHIQTIPYITQNVKIYYPRVVGMQNQYVQEKINHTIVMQLEALINEQGKYQVPGNTEVTGFYELKTNERGVLSLTQSNYSYTPPMAHGMTLLKSLTFDVQTGTGRAYLLKDLFKPNSNYVQRISQIISIQMKERDVPLLEQFKGIRPDQDFYITDKSLVIYFQLYELTPYVFGFPMFPISVYQLQDIIDEDGPLGKMLPGV